MKQEILFDRDLLKQNRKRALTGFAQASFLHHEIANRIVENVQFLNRKFENILEIAPLDEALKKEFTQIFDHNFSWKSCESEESLSQESQSFDLILSNLNFHFINEIPQFLLQVKELLKPNGVFIASFFGEENLSELAHMLYKTENEIYGGISPRMPPTIDVKTAANLLQKAGFGDPTAEFAKIEVEYEDPKNLLKDLKMMGQGNILHKRSRRFMTKNFLNKILQNYREIYPNNEGGVCATFEIVTVTGWK